MPDSNFNTGIDQLLARVITLIPASNTKQLYELSVCLRAINKTDDSTAETAYVNRFNTLLQASLNTNQKQYIARTIGNMLEKDFVDGVDLPTQASNVNKLLQTNGLSMSWVKENLNNITNVTMTSPTSGDTLSIDANSHLTNSVSPTRSFETYANVASLPGTDTTGKLAYAIAENSFHYWNGSAWQLITMSDGGPFGGVLFSTAGTHSWTAPAGVTSVFVVAVGAGAEAGATAGGGGGLGWKNNISVTPGQGYTVVVGSGGQNKSNQHSYFIDLTTVSGRGGSGAAGGTYTGDGGGNGGNGAGSGTYQFCGGGGAGGYTGNGGNGRAGNTGQAGNGSGGGGGGSMANSGGYTIGGGGVGVYGQGANGIGGVANIHPNQHPTTTGAGTGGSGGTQAVSTYGHSNAGIYGGGGGGGGSGVGGGDSGGGAVRIIWGGGRAFPTTNVDLASSTDGETTV